MLGRTLIATPRVLDRAARACTCASAGALTFDELRRAIEAEWRDFNDDEVGESSFPSYPYVLARRGQSAARLPR